MRGGGVKPVVKKEERVVIMEMDVDYNVNIIYKWVKEKHDEVHDSTRRKKESLRKIQEKKNA